MGPRELLRWQWEGYPLYHQSRANLLIHIFVVPLFLVGNAVLVVGLVGTSLVAAVIGLGAMMASVALQGVGHRTEATPPQPFTSLGNAVARLFLEQWVSFPRFVISGGWWLAMSHRLRLDNR